MANFIIFAGFILIIIILALVIQCYEILNYVYTALYEVHAKKIKEVERLTGINRNLRKKVRKLKRKCKE